jgi:heat shock protein HslJ
MKRRILFFLIYVLLPLIAPIRDMRSFAHGQSKPAVSGPSLIGKKWSLIEVNGTPVKSDRPYIQFGPKANRYSGNGGCNGFAGEYTTEGSHIKFSQAISTMMGCIDSEVQKVENDFLKRLNEATDFEVQDDLLRVLRDGHSILVFKGSSIRTAH